MFRMGFLLFPHFRAHFSGGEGAAVPVGGTVRHNGGVFGRGGGAVVVPDEV